MDRTGQERNGIISTFHTVSQARGQKNLIHFGHEVKSWVLVDVFVKLGR